MSEYENFDVSVDEGVATVTMRREPLNVLHMPMMAEFNTILEATLSGSNLAALVIRAKGKVFSAGVDVGDHTPDRVAEMIHLFHGIFRKLAATDVITIAAVQGAALGGGCELACFCDIVLASARAKFGQPEVHVGVFPPIAACVLPGQVGIKKAIELNALGGTIDAAEAFRIGLVNQVFAPDEFDESVDQYLCNIGKLSRPVVRLSKRATCLVSRDQVLAQLDQTEALYLDELMKLDDSSEGIAAFMEKRSPNWRHA